MIEELGKLPDEKQRRVLEYARSLAGKTVAGISGRELIRFAGTLPSEDAEEMRKAIEEGCEQIDADEW